MKKIFALVILLLISCGGGGERQGEIVQKEETTTIVRSVLMVIAHRDFRDKEFKEPYDIFTKSGMKVVVASTDTTPARGMSGMIVKPDINLAGVNTKDYDGIVIVGGDGCRILWDNKSLHEIVRSFNADKKMVAAICIAPMVLANAGILEDKIVTAYPSVRDEIGKCCAKCTDSDIEVSGNIITCSEPKAAADFAKTIIGAMNQ